MRISISVPRPCNENWDNMQPQGTARFCESCKHTVADLTKATDAELVDLFTGGEPPKCARFDPRQLDRALGKPPISLGGNKIPIAAFSSLLALATGQETLAQNGRVDPRPATEQTSGTGEQRDHIQDGLPKSIDIAVGQPYIGFHDKVLIVGDTTFTEVEHEPIEQVLEYQIDGLMEPMEDELLRPGPEEGKLDATNRIQLDEAVMNTLQIRGTLIDATTREPLPLATVHSSDGMHSTNTDLDGRFVLELPDAQSSIQFRYPGYDVLIINRIHGQPGTPTLECRDTPLLDRLPLTGRVVEHGTGTILQGIRVEWLEKGLFCCTDSAGMFGFSAEGKAMNSPATLRFSSAEHLPHQQPIPSGDLPFALPVTLHRRQAPTEAHANTVDLGEVELRAGMVLDEVYFEKRTFLQRFKRRLPGAHSRPITW